MKNSLILASTSKYRKKLLERLNIPFSVIAANIDETNKKNESPKDLVQRLSIEKANAIAKTHPDQWIIGSDQIAQLEGLILGKPGNKQNALEQLKSCSGKQIQFLTGVALVNKVLDRVFYIQSQVDVKFLTLSEQQINNYLEVDEPYDCAGSFKIETMGITLFEWVKSDDPTSLEGLPLIAVCKLLRQAGFELL